MTELELALLVASLAAIAIILTMALVERHRTTKLPPPMLFLLRITLGIVFAILGVIGSLLPIMQGWIFFLLAALVLFPQSRFAVGALDKIEKRMPRLVRWLRRMGIGVHRHDDVESINPS
ncbi:MAG: hypothetical protein ACLGH0_07665 [Thermoanaerobaculia bacterium]